MKFNLDRAGYAFNVDILDPENENKALWVRYGFGMDFFTLKMETRLKWLGLIR